MNCDWFQAVKLTKMILGVLLLLGQQDVVMAKKGCYGYEATACDDGCQQEAARMAFASATPEEMRSKANEMCAAFICAFDCAKQKCCDFNPHKVQQAKKNLETARRDRGLEEGVPKCDEAMRWSPELPSHCEGGNPAVKGPGGGNGGARRQEAKGGLRVILSVV